MNRHAVALLALCVPAIGGPTRAVPAVTSTVSARRGAYFSNLVPRTSQADVRAAVGNPDRVRSHEWFYRMRKGHIKVRFQGGLLVDCKHVDPGDGAVYTPLYWTWKATAAAAVRRHNRLLTKRSFESVEAWGESFAGSERYPRIHELADGFVVLEQGIFERLGTRGAFKGRIIKATVHRKGETPIVVYRLFDHWDSARPKGVSDELLAKRERALRTLGSRIIGRSAREMLGPEDGSGGSGVCPIYYYLRQGLLVTRQDYGVPDVITSISLEQPGAERPADLRLFHESFAERK